MGWSSDYKAKLCTPEQAVGGIRSGDHVYYSGNAAIPRQLVNALAKRHHELEGVELIHVLLLGSDPLSTPDMARSFRHNSLFVGPADREAINDGRGDYTPVFLFHIPRLFRERIIPLDVAMVQVSPPDKHGFMSLGVQTLASKAAVDEARTVPSLPMKEKPMAQSAAQVMIAGLKARVRVTAPVTSE